MTNGIQNMRRSVNRENPFWIAFLVVMCLSPLLAYSLPERALTMWPWARPFTDVMARLIPSIDRLTALSQFPDVTRLFMSLQWAIWGPVCVWLTVRFGKLSEKKMIDALRFAQLRWWSFFYLLPFGAVLVWVFVFFPFPNIGRGTTPFDHLVRWMSESPFWLGAAGSVIVASTMVVTVVVIKSYTVIRLAYRVHESFHFNKTKEHR